MWHLRQCGRFSLWTQWVLIQTIRLSFLRYSKLQVIVHFYMIMSSWRTICCTLWLTACCRMLCMTNETRTIINMILTWWMTCLWQKIVWPCIFFIWRDIILNIVIVIRKNMINSSIQIIRILTRKKERNLLQLMTIVRYIMILSLIPS